MATAPSAPRSSRSCALAATTARSPVATPPVRTGWWTSTSLAAPATVPRSPASTWWSMPPVSRTRRWRRSPLSAGRHSSTLPPPPPTSPHWSCFGHVGRSWSASAWRPGLTNLLAAAVHGAEPGPIDIALLLGAGERHGAAATAWSYELLGKRFRDPNGRLVRNYTRPRRFALPGYGWRRLYRADFADQHALSRDLGVPVRTYFGLDSAGDRAACRPDLDSRGVPGAAGPAPAGDGPVAGACLRRRWHDAMGSRSGSIARHGSDDRRRGPRRDWATGRRPSPAHGADHRRRAGRARYRAGHGWLIATAAGLPERVCSLRGSRRA